jgi:hypothetical protein
MAWLRKAAKTNPIYADLVCDAATGGVGTLWALHKDMEHYGARSDAQAVFMRALNEYTEGRVQLEWHELPDTLAGWRHLIQEGRLMNRATPVETRKALAVAHELAKAGIWFVPMPVLSDADHAQLAAQIVARMEHLADTP